MEGPNEDVARRAGVRPRVAAPAWWGSATSRGSRRRMPELLLGSGLVIAGALGAVVWSSRGATERVAVASRTLHRGEAVTSTMVRWMVVSGDHLRSIGPADLEPGRLLAVEVPAGAALRDSDFVPPIRVGDDEAVIGLSLEPGAAPTGLRPGERVIVVVTPASSSDGSAVEPIALDEPAVVYSAPHTDDSPAARMLMDLVVRRSDLVTIAGAVHIRLARLADADATTIDPGATDSTDGQAIPVDTGVPVDTDVPIEVTIAPTTLGA